MFSAAWRVLPRAAAGVAAAGLASPAHSFYDARKEIGAYKLGPTLGEGAFATVRQATSESGTYACKIINVRGPCGKIRSRGSLGSRFSL